MKPACMLNANTDEQNTSSPFLAVQTIRPLKINFVRIKNTFFLIVSALFVFLPLKTNLAQEYSPIEWLLPYQFETNTGTYTYSYHYEMPDRQPCAIRLNITRRDKKGAELLSIYDFFLPDIDESAIQFRTTGKYFTIRLSAQDNQKLLKESDKQGLKNYHSFVEMYTDNLDYARGITDDFRAKLKECRLNSLSFVDVDATIDWLQRHVDKVERGTAAFGQQFYVDNNKRYIAQYTRTSTDSKGGAVSDTFVFNITDIDPHKIVLEASGINLSVKLPIKSGDNFIGYTRNGAQQNYRDNLEIYAPDLETARHIMDAFRFLAGKMEPAFTQFTQLEQSLQFITSNLPEINTGSSKMKQILEYKAEPTLPFIYQTGRTDAKGTVTTDVSHFYLDDLDAAVKLKVSGREIKIEMQTKERMRFIRNHRNNALQGYAHTLTIHANDIETARELQNAFNYAILNKPTGLINFDKKDFTLDWISANIGSASDSIRSLDQNIIFNEVPYPLVHFTATTGDAGALLADEYHFYLPDLNGELTKIVVSGKKLYVTLSTGRNKLIKNIKSNQIQSFASSFNVYFDDTRTAQNFLQAMRYLASVSVHAGPSKTELNEIINLLGENLKSVSTGTLVYDQKLETIDNQICKWRLSITQTDTKGVATGFVYEFSPSDIGEETTVIAVSGKEMCVKIECKDKQKLIKPYKNGTAQNFAAEFKLYADDAYNGRLLSDLIKLAVKACGK